MLTFDEPETVTQVRLDAECHNEHYIICPGGRTASKQDISFIYSFDLTSEKWTAATFPELQQPMFNMDAKVVELADGTHQLVILSGQIAKGFSNIIQGYNFEKNYIQNAVDTGNGGLNFAGRPALTGDPMVRYENPAVLEFDFQTNAALWKYQKYPPMPHPRWSAASVVIRDLVRKGEREACHRIFIIGGRNKDGFVPEVDVFNLRYNQWETDWKGLDQGELENIPPSLGGTGFAHRYVQSPRQLPEPTDSIRHTSLDHSAGKANRHPGNSAFRSVLRSHPATRHNERKP